jgi:hypothetical protein
MMRDGDSVEEHLNTFNIVVSQLVSVEIKISDEYSVSIYCTLYEEHGRTNHRCIICKRTLPENKYIQVLKWEI